MLYLLYNVSVTLFMFLVNVFLNGNNVQSNINDMQQSSHMFRNVWQLTTNYWLYWLITTVLYEHKSPISSSIPNFQAAFTNIVHMNASCYSSKHKTSTVADTSTDN